jgi:steroid 5-alpha reductase family enzyme
MFDVTIYLSALVWLAVVAVLGWLVAVLRRNVDLVDSLWSLMFLLALVCYWRLAPQQTERGLLLIALVGVWALRLSVYLTARNWGHDEDRRYRAIRARNDPGFTFKSLYLVFGFQAVLAWLISVPLLGATLGDAPLGPFDYLGVSLWVVGFVFEAGGDWQLARFKRDPANAGKVMDRGFWRYTRHPNYFGDFAIWWGFYAIALSAGAWWSIPGPLLMSVLLLRVSGVRLLERDIGERRPAYADYVRRTNAFFPGPPKA